MPFLDLGGPAANAVPGTTCQPWAEPGDVCAPCNAYDFDEDVLAEGLQLATDVLFEFTGRRWSGECVDTIRPCSTRSTSCGCRETGRVCGCTRLSQFELPLYPVGSILEVKVDGAAIDPSLYRVDDNRWLVYLPESASAARQGWPCCQRIDLADTEEDTWSISYTYGADPPAGGMRAAATLGCELALACSDNDTVAGQCRLPQRVTSITRQGMSMALLDPLTLFSDGRTGLSDVDLWIESVNVGSRRRPATVTAIGSGARVRRTNT